LKPVVDSLSELLSQPVSFIADATDDAAIGVVNNMKPGDVAVCENLRFHEQEEANDDAFAKKLAVLGDIYVDDDFTVMHREHASVVGIPKYLPSVCGFLVEKEVTTIMSVLENPVRPLMAIVGGAKISTKIEIMDNLLSKVEAIFVGGAMANTFLAANGLAIGKSLAEPKETGLAKRIESTAQEKKIQFFLPIDVVVTDDLKNTTNIRTVDTHDVGPKDIIVDVGPKSIKQLDSILAQKGTVIWNGPIGITETPEFAVGSKTLAAAIINSGAHSLVGGGDTAGFVDEAGISDKFGFVSTGGGASLELMSGNKLPGLEILEDKD